VAKKRWCIPELTPDFRERMDNVLNQYERPPSEKEPVFGLDEQPLQMLADSRPGEAMRLGQPAKQDYEYRRCGTCSVFVAVTPKAGRRIVQVRKHRKKADFARLVRDVLKRHPRAKKIHLVLDNLNTHQPESLIETFGPSKAATMLRRIEWHHTPKHASWLNMVEAELSAMARQCTSQRLASVEKEQAELNAWTKAGNRKQIRIQQKSNKTDAKKVFPSLYSRKKLAG
jgi:transposase